jgi:galacturonosyltransferase
MKEKGIDELIESVKKLKDEGYNFVLDMAGFFEDEYQTKIEKLQEEGIIAFHGFQDSLKEFYAKADCIVMPSYHEGMNNVILEGSSCGRAVIASDIPGCREAVEDGVTGFLCKSKDVETLYSAMKRFLELPREARIKFGEAAREKMVREFDKHIVVEKIMNVLRKV